MLSNVVAVYSEPRFAVTKYYEEHSDVAEHRSEVAGCQELSIW